MRTRFIITIVLLLSALPLAAQDVTITASVDSTDYLIGQWIYTHLDITVPDGVKATLPSSDEQLEGAEFVSVDFTEESKKADGLHYRRDIVVTAFDTGSYSFRVLVPYTRDGDTTKYIARSNPVALRMTTVQVDTSTAFKDIRDVMHVPLSLWDYLLIAGIVLLVLALAWFAWRWWKRRPEAEAPPVERVEPDVPAHVLARQRLSELEKKRLWQEGKHKQYQSEVTDIVRAYIEQRFNIPALEEITSEIVSDLALAGLDPSLVARSEAVLRLADQTKFARYTPSPAEHEAALRYAYEFVDATAADSAQAPAVRDDGGGKA